MNTVRLIHQSAIKDKHTVMVEYNNKLRQTATVEFEFSLSEPDQNLLRWYLEDYLQNVYTPEKKIATRVEQQIIDKGIELFEAIFKANDDARDLWATLRSEISDTRIEISSGLAEGVMIPWELMRDPKTDTVLALQARSFVRIHSQPARLPKLPRVEGDTIRILLVIARPAAGEDVPFRSVAGRLLKGLSRADRQTVQLDLLRPPTYEQLSRVLRQTKAAGKPYHVLHFDGHGTYLEHKDPASLKEMLGQV
ncbi:MAG: hypothetical protein GY869_12245, partial [Planctomycetes bacterium]|nr:hypothetical protein [Planctomycetota bacterium]